MRVVFLSCIIILGLAFDSQAFTTNRVGDSHNVKTTYLAAHDNPGEFPVSRRETLFKGAAALLGVVAGTEATTQPSFAATPEADTVEEEVTLTLPHMGINAGLVGTGYAAVASVFLIPDDASSAVIQNTDAIEEASNFLVQNSDSVTTTNGFEECGDLLLAQSDALLSEETASTALSLEEVLEL